MNPPRKRLNPEELALNAYIAAMFVSAPTELAEPPEPRLKEVARLLAEAIDAPPRPAEATTTEPQRLAQMLAPQAAPEPAPVTAPVITPAPVIVPETVIVPEAAPAESAPPEVATPLIPDWGRGEFQTLFFQVGALTLAVPLSELGGIHPITDKLTPLFGKPDWFMGLQASGEGNIQLVDTARWVMPEKLESSTALPYEYFILLKGTPWGLACTEVHDAVTLRHADVRWRTQLGRRPWLAGVVVDKMCALLDVENFIALIHSSAP